MANSMNKLIAVKSYITTQIIVKTNKLCPCPKNACVTNLLSIVALVRSMAKSRSDQRYKEKQAMLQATREGLKMSPTE